MFEKRMIKNKNKTYIGYDFGDGYAQISYYMDGMQEPKTLPSAIDEEVFKIPDMLVKVQGIYYAGVLAMAHKDDVNAIVFEDIFKNALESPNITVANQRFSTLTLLTMFLNITLEGLQSYFDYRMTNYVMFTTNYGEDEDEMVLVQKLIAKAVETIFSRKTKYSVQSRQESIAHFLLGKGKEYIHDGAMIFDYQKGSIKGCYVERIGDAPPYLIKVHNKQYPEVTLPKDSVLEMKIPRFKREVDTKFLAIVNAIPKKETFRNAYLIGDGFKGDWLEESLEILCEKGKVFQGNTLYSLGACYQLINSINNAGDFEDYKYLKADSIMHEIGIYVRKQGFNLNSIDKEYLGIFRIGDRVKHCSKEIELIPANETSLELVSKSIYNKGVVTLQIPLDRIPKRDIGETKIKVNIKFDNEKTLKVKVEDIGFKEVLPGSGKSFTDIFILE